MPRGVPNNRVIQTQTSNEIHVDDLPLAAAPEADFDNRSETVIPVDKPLDSEYMAALAFAEDELTIRIEPGDEENGPLALELWVNGVGAEVKDTITGRFLPLGALPVGQPIITKRKYVEQLARSRVDRVSTDEQHEDTTKNNSDVFRIRRSSHRKSMFSVIHDPSPKGREWLTRLYAER